MRLAPLLEQLLSLKFFLNSPARVHLPYTIYYYNIFLSVFQEVFKKKLPQKQNFFNSLHGELFLALFKLHACIKTAYFSFYRFLTESFFYQAPQKNVAHKKNKP